MTARGRELLIGLAIAAATIILTLLALGVLHSQPTKVVCVDSETRERMRTLALEGYDQALRDHSALLFDIWVKDGHDQPRRAVNGTQAAISAYVRARALALSWNPPAC